MTRFFTITVLALFATPVCLALAACSSDDTSAADAGQNGTVNTQGAKGSSTTLVGGVSVAVNQNQGMASLQQLVAGAQQAQGIVTPGAAAQTGTTTKNVTLSDAILVGQVSQAITSCNDACKGTVCEFKGCGTDEAGTVVINGTLSWTAGNVKCVGLTYDIDQSSVGGAKTKITLDCDVTATATSLKGKIKSTGTTSAAALLKDAGVGSIGDISWSSDTTFVDVTYASGKPTGGKVQVTASTTTAGQTYTGSAEVSFP